MDSRDPAGLLKLVDLISSSVQTVIQIYAAAGETVRLDSDVSSVSNSSEIVVRDRHGEIEWGEPPSPDLEEQLDMPMDNRLEIERE